MTLEDLASYRGEWVTPATTNYHGYDVFTLPPPAQTWAAEEMLNILEVCVPKWAPGQTLATLGPANPKYWHLFVEAKKLAFNDLYAFNADPNFASVPLERLLSKVTCTSRCVATSIPIVPRDNAGANAESGGDTIVLSTADRFGNMVAWVNSLYWSFGSGLTVPGYGITLHNRGGVVHARSEESECDRAAQAPVQHAVGGLRHARQQAADDRDADGRRRAGARHRAGSGEYSRSRRQRAGCIRHGALSSHAGAEPLMMESQLFKLVGAQLKAMGHDVALDERRRRWADTRPSW